jgi:hypothetical protein
LFPHFLRGLFDGDGCISGKFYKNNKKMQISLSIVSASLSFLQTLKDKIKEYLDLNSTVILDKKADPTKGKKGHSALYLLSIDGGRRQMENLYRSLYKDAHFYLYRKRNRFDSFILSKYFYKLPQL